MESLYWYCTDFCINMANLLGISYLEFNFWLFLVIFPGVFLGLLIANLIRYVPSLIRRFSEKED
jgi:hypothetical protein